MCPAARKAARQPCTNGSRGLPDGRLNPRQMRVIAEALTALRRRRWHCASMSPLPLGFVAPFLPYGPPAAAFRRPLAA